MKNTQEQAKQMFDAAMKIKVIDSSIQRMEESIFGPK